MFLLNLSLMDLLRIIVCLPSAVILDVTQNWYLGTPLCKMVAFIEAFAIFVSELTLSYIAYDRWQSLQNPFKSSNSSSIQKPKIVIILTWILAAVLALPEPFMSNVISTMDDEPRNHSTIHHTTCTRDWSKDTDAFYVIIKVTFSFCCPLLFMLVIYSKVIRYIWKHKALTPAHFFYGSTSRGRFNEPLPVRSLNRQWMLRFQRRKQTINMLIAMTIVYNLGYFQLYVITIIKFFVVFKDDKLRRAIKMMSHWFCYSTSVIAPIIYTFMSVRFRAEFSHMCKNPASYSCFCEDKAHNTKNVSSTLEETSENKVDNPLIPMHREQFVEDVVPEVKEEHKDLVSMPSTLSQQTHRTLSPMASDTSASTNCTRSTNLSSDTEIRYNLDTSTVISEEGIIKLHTNLHQDAYESKSEKDVIVREIKSVKEETVIDIRRKSNSPENNDVFSPETICAQVHCSSIKKDELFNNPNRNPDVLRSSKSLYQTPIVEPRQIRNSKRNPSCPILTYT
jgi:hypothetical protein